MSFCNTSQRLQCSLSLLIRSSACENAPHVQHLAGVWREFDHGPTWMIRENAPFVLVATPENCDHRQEELYALSM